MRMSTTSADDTSPVHAAAEVLMVRLLAWNVNHRMRPRHIPTWVAEIIGEQRPDIVVLTEYVEGPDHAVNGG